MRTITYLGKQFFIDLITLGVNSFSLEITKESQLLLKIKTEFIDIDDNKELFNTLEGHSEADELYQLLNVIIQEKISKKQHKDNKKDAVKNCRLSKERGKKQMKQGGAAF